MENAVPTPESAQLTCPHCETAITYYDVKDSSFFACSNCHTYFSYIHEGPPQIIRDFRLYQPSASEKPVLAIGAQGVLADNQYRVVGQMTKTEESTPSRWHEYLLYSPVVGYAQLAEYQGHWQLIEPANETYVVRRQMTGVDTTLYYIEDQEKRYDLFHTYSPRLLSATGEFDWNILDEEKLTIHEYIAPPSMLVQEDSGQASVWYKSVYLDKAAVAQAFGLSPESLPVSVGAGAIQPQPDRTAQDLRLVLTMRVCMVILLIMGAVTLWRSPDLVMNDTYYSTVGDTTGFTALSSGSRGEFVSKSFTINGPTAVAINVKATVNNEWIELGVSMIDEITGQTYEFTKSIEYYHGVDGGESWSEGSQEEEAVLSRVSSGRYHLIIAPYAETRLPLTVNVQVKQHAILWSNLWLLLVLAALVPAVQYWQRQRFEKQRWADSEYGVQEESD